MSIVHMVALPLELAGIGGLERKLLSFFDRARGVKMVMVKNEETLALTLGHQCVLGKY